MEHSIIFNLLISELYKWLSIKPLFSVWSINWNKRRIQLAIKVPQDFWFEDGKPGYYVDSCGMLSARM